MNSTTHSQSRYCDADKPWYVLLTSDLAHGVEQELRLQLRFLRFAGQVQASGRHESRIMLTEVMSREEASKVDASRCHRPASGDGRCVLESTGREAYRIRRLSQRDRLLVADLCRVISCSARARSHISAVNTHADGGHRELHMPTVEARVAGASGDMCCRSYIGYGRPSAAALDPLTSLSLCRRCG